MSTHFAQRNLRVRSTYTIYIHFLSYAFKSIFIKFFIIIDFIYMYISLFNSAFTIHVDFFDGKLSLFYFR